MHPNFGCEKRVDKLPVSLECVAQDLEAANENASEIEDQGLPSSFTENQDHVLTITELSDCSGDSTFSGSPSSLEVNVPDFPTMANLSNNGFTFPSPSVVAYTQSVSSQQARLPFSLASSNGIKQYSPGISSSTCSTIQFPTPLVSCSVPMAGACGTSSYCVPSGRADPLTWQPPTGPSPMSSEPMHHVPMSGLPSSMQRLEQVAVQTSNPRERVPKGKKKFLKSATTMCISRQGKRKAEESPDTSRKVHVNEARMAARMQELHLDNNNLEWHPNLEEEPWYSRVPDERSSGPTSQAELDSLDDEADSAESDSEQGSKATNGLPSLELSKELQLGFKTKELLPRVLMEQLHKPSMQLVLWKPPGDFVKDMVQDMKSVKPEQTPKLSTSSKPEGSVDMLSSADTPDMDLEVMEGGQLVNPGQSEDVPAASGLSMWPPVSNEYVTPNGKQEKMKCSELFDSVDDDMDL